MIDKLLGRRKEIAFFVFSLLILTVNFQDNFFHSAADDFFERHELGSESLVIGRLANTQQNGFFSGNGFLGRFQGLDLVRTQFDAYASGTEHSGAFYEYRSSAGLQGFFYGALDRIYYLFGITEATQKYELHRLFTSLSLALTLSFFLAFVYAEFGFFTSIFTLVMLCYSQWIVVFGDNLYWMACLIFLPFVIVTWVLKREEYTGAEENRLLLLLLFTVLFLKFCAGYEFVSTLFISMTVPLFYFFLKNNWDVRVFTRRFIMVSVIGFSALLVSMLVHLFMMSLATGSISVGIEKIKGTILKRTYGNADMVGEVYRQSLESNVSEVILRYWHGKAYDLYNAFGVDETITFGQIIVFMLVVSVVSTVLVKLKRLPSVVYSKYYALLAALWLSLSAPLSWYVLAKGHSYIHVFINQILWYVPFLILAFVFTGYSLALLASAIHGSSSRWARISLYFGLLLIGGATIYKLTYSSVSKKENYIKHTNFFATGPGVDGIRIGVYGNTLVFLSPSCDKSSLQTRFFLHYVPVSINDLPKSRIQYKYDNADFNWFSQSQFGPSLFGKYKNYCLALVKAPNYVLRGLRTGQFTRSGKVWEVGVNFSDYRTKVGFSAFNLDDNNWKGGVHRRAPAFFVQNDFDLRQSLLPGNEVIMPGSGVRVIKSVSLTDSYINVVLEGGALDLTTDGAPNEIRIKPTALEAKKS